MEQKFGNNIVLLERVAAGGMGEVFRAKQHGTAGFQKTVAVKRILPQYASHPAFAEMFQFEMNLAAKLQHPNIVQVYSNGREGSYLYLVMEFIKGRTVANLLNVAGKRRLRIPPEISCFIVAEAVLGLSFAHSLTDEDTHAPLNIIHRDISPQNILLGFGGEVKVADFGIAKAADRVDGGRTGELRGKVPYAAPEYILGQPIDHRIDIFAIGVLLYELLSQKPLFAAKNSYETLQNILEMEIPSLVENFSDVRFELDGIVMRALQRDPDKRYSTAEEMHRALIAFMSRIYPRFTRTDFASYIVDIFSDNPQNSIPFERAAMHQIGRQAPPIPSHNDDGDGKSAVPESDEESDEGWAMSLKMYKFLAISTSVIALGLGVLIASLFIFRGDKPKYPPSNIPGLVMWLQPSMYDRSGTSTNPYLQDQSWLSADAKANSNQPSFISDSDGARLKIGKNNAELHSPPLSPILSRIKEFTLFYRAALSEQDEKFPVGIWGLEGEPGAASPLYFGFGSNSSIVVHTSEKVSLNSETTIQASRLGRFSAYSVQITEKQILVRKDGTEIANILLTSPIPLGSATGLTFGGAQGVKPFSGELGEIILYSRALTTDEMVKVESYLKD